MSARMTMMESSANTLVYLHRNPRPIRTPVRTQCQENSGLFSTTHQNENMAATQKKSESHAGAFAEISGRKSLRPHPIMRLVELQIGRGQQRQTQAREHGEKKPDRPLDLHDAEAGIS